MKKMTRLMAMLLSLLVLFQSAALADGTTAVSSDAVTEELYQGWVETATTYAADADAYSKYINSSTYPVYLTVIRGSSNFDGIPSEPAYYNSTGYSFFQSNYKSSGTRAFSVTTERVISEDIISHVNFIPSVTSDGVYGLADQTGVETIAMLPGVDFDKLLQGVEANNNDFYDSDGELVEKSNIENYRVVPYVIKVQESVQGHGWHIDCILIKKGVILAYDLNLPTGVQITDSAKVAAPFAETYVFKNGETSHDFVVKDVTGIGSDKAIKVSLGNKSYTAHFRGWNTEPDGSGEMKQPSENYTISKDTTLYAIWEFDPGLGRGDLLVRKSVVDSEGNPVTDDTTVFSFRLDLPSDDKEQHTYTKYNANNVAVSNGTISDGGSFTLLNGQFVVIDNLYPMTDDAELTENDEKHEGWANVTEIEADGYTTTWKSGNVNGNKTTVNVQDALVTSVVCENKAAPRNTTVTITKQVAGNMGDRNKEFAITFDVKLNGEAVTGYTVWKGNTQLTAPYTIKHDETIVLKNVPIGATVTVTETDTAYIESYKVNGATEATTGYKATVTANAEGTASIEFVNTKNETVDTGILLDSLPYVLILVLVGGGVVLWLANRRRRRED